MSDLKHIWFKLKGYLFIFFKWKYIALKEVYIDVLTFTARKGFFYQTISGEKLLLPGYLIESKQLDFERVLITLEEITKSGNYRGLLINTK